MKIQCDVCGKTIDTESDLEHADFCPEQILGPIHAEATP